MIQAKIFKRKYILPIRLEALYILNHDILLNNTFHSQQNQEVKQELENSKKEKEKVRVKCKKLQDQTVSLDKEIKALQEAGKAQEASQ